LPGRTAGSERPSGEGGCWRLALTDPAVWALVGAGLALRLVVWALLPERGFVSDETEYYAAARVLADGRGFSYYDAAPWLRPPGYILMLAASFRLFGPTIAPVQILQLGLSLALGPLVAWLSLLGTGRRDVARLAAGLTLLLLPLAVLPWLLLSETLFTVLLLLGIGGLLARWRGGGIGWLALAGVALGGACLTRGLAIGYVGLVVVGLALWGRGDRRRRLRDAVVLAAIVAAVIAPWMLRNWLAYRAIVPLETTAAYNFWLRAQGGRGESWMLSELLEQPDLPTRQAHALQRGLALARQDPGGYLARGWRELGDVARLNFGAAERFMAGFAAGEVSRPWLALALALDDLLYLALLPLAALGLLRRGGALRWLTLGWLSWMCLTALTFFAIARFRAPLLPLLAIQAAIGAVELRSAWRTRAGRRGVAIAAPIAVVLVAIVLPSIDLRAYADGWRARADWQAAQAAEALRLAGDPAGALAALDAGGAGGLHAALTRGLSLGQLSRPADAEAALTPYRQDARALVAIGEGWRLAGDQASAGRFWGTREVDAANPLDWSWARLNQLGPRVGVGDGLDLGLLRGMHADERDGDVRYRWTDGRGEIRLWLADPTGCRLSARLRAHRPGGEPVEVAVSVNGQRSATWTVGDAWSEHVAYVQPDRPIFGVTLESQTFVPGYADSRPLGVMVDWIECRSPRS
jgi:4-amino-4-deoxy-L-arabinose transferase-like glycosyltransferase